MIKYPKYWIVLIITVLVASTVFSVGIFNNPNFDIHDFCMGLSTEILGAIIIVVLFERYAHLKNKRKQELQSNKQNQKKLK